MSDAKVRNEMWRAYKAVRYQLKLPCLNRKEFERAMAIESAADTAEDGTIDGADLRKAMQHVAGNPR